MSANADSYQVFIRGQNASDGGTSASTPLWAALIALVNQGIGDRAGLLQTILYALPAAAPTTSASTSLDLLAAETHQRADIQAALAQRS